MTLPAFLTRLRHTSRLRILLAATALVAVVAACGGGDGTGGAPGQSNPTGLSLESLGAFEGGALGAAEITAYDDKSKRLFVVNGANGTVDVLDLSDPKAPARVGTITPGTGGESVNSVAVHDGLVALAVQANPKTANGQVMLVDAATLTVLHRVGVGALPDMLTFTPDGTRILVANEGEPSAYPSTAETDPEGSVSVITVNRGGVPTVATADFKAYIGKEDALRAQGIRIYGPGANAAQDFEPEYITVSDDGGTAWVTLQENNAVATIDVATAKVTSVLPLGTKDHSIAGMGLDASDEDGGTDTDTGTPAIKIATYKVKGMYLPDAIASYTVAGKTYLITANEGDARADWPGYNEETRVRAHCAAGLDPTVFPDAATLVRDSNLGRLRVTTNPNGGQTGKNAAGQCTELFAFGGRSFSIWDTSMQRVYDSGDQMEQRTRDLPNVKFNASHDNDTLDSRSPSKGPEPEGVVIGKFGQKHFAFIGLERVGGVMVYDVSNPLAPVFVTYFNGARSGVTGDRGPEGLTLIPASRSPNGKPLLVVGNEVSGTTRILQINLTY